jgi:hypothetical protein
LFNKSASADQITNNISWISKTINLDSLRNRKKMSPNGTKMLRTTGPELMLQQFLSVIYDLSIMS